MLGRLPDPVVLRTLARLVRGAASMERAGAAVVGEYLAVSVHGGDPDVIVLHGTQLYPGKRRVTSRLWAGGSSTPSAAQYAIIPRKNGL